MNSENRTTMIESRLTEAFHPIAFKLKDDSHKHAGHAGNVAGGGHFTVLIVSDRFQGKSLLQRHRMVYDALGEAMQKEIHALSIQAKTPDEFNNS